MKILVIEDDPIKLRSIKDFLMKHSSDIIIYSKMSYQAGLLAMLKDTYNLILLDMQLPNYDIKSGEDGFMLRPLAGRDILREVKRKGKTSKVVIITQYDTFNENGNFRSLDEWHNYFTEEFSTLYLQTIFYNPSSSSWKVKLEEVLKINFE